MSDLEQIKALEKQLSAVKNKLENDDQARKRQEVEDGNKLKRIRKGITDWGPETDKDIDHMMDTVFLVDLIDRLKAEVNHLRIDAGEYARMAEERDFYKGKVAGRVIG
jgi:hypothetical protein